MHATGLMPAGLSIYGPTFEDENFTVRHSKRGVVAMCNTGLHANASQFSIALRPLPWMQHKFVAFGCVARVRAAACDTGGRQVIEGDAVLDQLQRLETRNTRPVVPCVIIRAGEYRA